MIKVKTIIRTLGFSALLLVSSAQAETLSNALKSCGQVQNSLKRLVCYDKIVNEMNRYGDLDQLMSIPAPLSATPSQAPAAKNNVPQQTQSSAPAKVESAYDDFGLEAQRRSEELRNQKMYAKVVKIEKNARKKRIFFLDNGHVWRETEGISLQIKVGQSIYIERGALGSFHLSRDDVNRRIRVKRDK